ncbi:MAG: HlyD family secretion protein [Thermosulfidibacteraceae bacterium]|jgi:membrane fusion protein (multidrug efflux system)
MRKKLIFVIVFIIGIISIGTGIYLILQHKWYAITNAVFVESKTISNIGFNRVGGKIVKMTKEEGDPVKEGEILAEIDQRDIRLKKEQLEKEIEALGKQKEQLLLALSRTAIQSSSSVSISESNARSLEKKIQALKNKLKALDATIEQLRRDYDRNKFLYENNAIAKRNLEVVETELKAKIAEREATLDEIKSLEEQLKSAISQVEYSKAGMTVTKEILKQIESIDAKIWVLRKELEDVNNLISYSVLKAPFSGKIGKKYVNVGAVVAPGQPVYAIVNPKDIYILVLLEEEKMEGVKPGAKAKITIDAYPNEEYEGVVSEILPTSAAKFALVPRDISAGEFTKVSQRIPVKIRITKGDISKLVVGMGGEVKIKRLK